MTRYFFNVSADDESVADLVGIDLPDIEAVRRYAASQVTELWEARVLAGKPPLIGWLDVVDDQERGVIRIPL